MPGGLTLLAPIGLTALAAVVAIVLIHMRRRTPPTIVLPSLRFWVPATADSSDRRRLRKPPISLPFVLQVLAALIIGLALARPVMNALPGMAGQRTTPMHTIVILDGSTSMLAQPDEDDTTTKWDLAREEAETMIDEWQNGDVATLVMVGSRIQSTSASTQPQIDRMRDQLRSSPAPGGIADIDAALELSADLVLPGRTNRLVVITDGAIRVNPEISASVAAPIELRVAGTTEGTAPNVAVTSIGSRPVPGSDDTWRLSFAVSSFAPEAVRLPYRVQADGVDVVASEIDLVAGETRPIEVTLPGGARTADVFLDVRDTFAADNRATMLLGNAASSGSNVLLISDNPGALERALTALPQTTVEVFPTTTPGIRALAAGFDLVVFQGVTPFPDDLPGTPMLLVRPTPLEDRFGSQGVMSAPVIDRMNAGASILDGVDLAGVTFGDTPAYVPVEGEEELVRGTANGVTGPLVWRGEIDGDRYVAFGFDLESSNITQRVAFPVLIARSVADLTTPPMPSSLSLGEPMLYQVSTGATEVVVTSPEGTVTSLDSVESGTVLFEGTGTAGMYSVAEHSEGGEALAESVFVVNAGHPVESDLRPNPSLEDSLQGGEVGDTSVESRRGLADIWPMLVAIATVVIVLEWLAFSAGWLRLPSLRRLPIALQRTGGRA
jgi:hypothetical protein